MRHHRKINKSGILYTTSIIGFFASLHVAIISYFNSSFLSTFTDEKTVGLIYILISVLTIIGLLFVHKILEKIGNLRLALALILIQIAIFYGIIRSDSFEVISPLMILGMSTISLIIFTIDIFLQKNTLVKDTGNTRGIYMTAMNIAWILGPLLGGALIVGDNYRGVYVTAFALLFPLLYLVYRNFNNFKDSKYAKVSTIAGLKSIMKNKDLKKIFFVNIILQTFMSWMVIYSPIYLNKNIGFEWSEISVIFTIMLLPFVLVEFPLGKLSDKKYGEKEIMALGFIIMGIFSCVLSLFVYKNLALWALMLFLTRIGAAASEVMIETYFFKKVKSRDLEILSIFRITRPMSYFVAPVITIVGLLFTTDRYLFVIMGIICLLTAWPTMALRDTK